jgi:hypothetical protein
MTGLTVKEFVPHKQTSPGSGGPTRYFDHQAKIQRRHHLHETAVQKAMKQAVVRAGAGKPATPHTLMMQNGLCSMKSLAKTSERLHQFSNDKLFNDQRIIAPDVPSRAADYAEGIFRIKELYRAL